MTDEKVDYYVTLGVVYKKPGKDPATQKILKLSRKVGAIVHTTGKIWKGAAGGFWVELDTSVGDTGAGEKAGYAMIDANGFGTPGPCLQKVNADDGEPILLRATLPEGGKAWDGGSAEKVFLVLKKTNVMEVKVILGMLFGLDQGGISVLGASGALSDETTAKDAGFETGAEVKFEFKGAKSMTLIVRSPLEASAGQKILDLQIKDNWTVGQVAKLIADRTGLNKASMIMAKGKMGERVPESAKMDETKLIVDYGLSDGDEVAFMYLGNLEGDLEAFMKSIQSSGGYK